LSLLALLVIGLESPAQERSPIPRYDEHRHVYVGEGIPGDYGSIEHQIEGLERATTPSFRYYVVVVRSAGPHSATATRDYTDELFRVWSNQAAARGRPLDPASTVLIVVATENQQVAVHPGTALSRLGLHGEKIHQEVVEPSGFLRIAPGGRYP